MRQLIRQDLDYKPATSDFLQHIDYRYNIRGWLTSINNAELEDDGTINFDDLDVFGEEIYYDNTDAISIDQGEESPFVPLNQYNGNISSIRWKSKTSDIPSDARPENVYCYRYDDLNQMTAAYYARTEAGVSGYYDQDYHLFNEKLGYGLDGNIRSFNRTHADGLMDELVYSYEGHKLIEVTDAITASIGNGFTDGNTTGDDFNYDANGNLLGDLNKDLTFQYNHLNLPKLIEDGTDELRYIYDATGRKLRTIYPDSKVHDYVSGIEYNDNELLFLNTSFGRIKATGPQAYCSVNFAYEYFIKDHLGSVRAVITREENAPQHNYSATMEMAVLTEEEAQFYNIDETRDNNHLALNAVNGSDYASRVKSTEEPIGPAKVLYVQEGDKISIDVQYYYPTYTGGNSPRDVNDILAQLANFFITTGSVAPPGLESAWAASTFTGNSAVSSLINNAITEPDDVLAYLAYITLDENFNLIPDASGYLMADADNSVENLTILDLVIPKNGYIYIYVANESPTDVYFDNLQIIHKKSNVLELNDYYPYGLRNESLSYTGLSFDPANNYHYQDKEFQTALGLNMHEFGLRHYDATLGRWGVQDPFMQFYNPYLAMGNNPVSYIDPDGGKVFPSYTKGENEQPIQGGDGGGWRSALSQYMMMSPFAQQSFQGAYGTATKILNALGSNPTMLVGVFIDILSDGTTVINTSSGNFDVNAFNNASNGSNNDPNKDFTLPGYTLPTVNIEDLRTNSTFVSSYAYNNFDVYAQGNGGYSNFDFASDIVGGLGLGVDLGAYRWDNFSNKQQWKSSYKTHQYLKGKGYNIKTSTIKNGIPKGFKAIGTGLGIVSGVITVGDALYNSQINASHILDATITGVSFIPAFGWAIGGGYFVGDMIHRGVYGYSIGDRLDNAVGGSVYNWDW